MPSKLIVPAAAVALVAFLAACGGASTPTAATTTAAAAPASSAPATPAVTATGDTGTECEQFEPVYQQITAATKGKIGDDGLMAAVLTASGHEWSDELGDAGKAATATDASIDMLEAAFYVSLADLDVSDGTTALGDWDKVRGRLKKIQAECTGQ